MNSEAGEVSGDRACSMIGVEEVCIYMLLVGKAERIRLGSVFQRG
jgi:hypothetical protein